MAAGVEQATPLDKAKQLLFRGDYEAARATCNDLLAANSEDYEATLFRGQVHHKESLTKDGDEHRKLLDAAIADFTRAIELGPTRPDGYDFRYHVYMELAEKETDREVKREWEELAAADYGKLRKYDPSAIVAFKNEIRTVPQSLAKPAPLDNPIETEMAMSNQESEPKKNPFLAADDAEAPSEIARSRTDRGDGRDRRPSSVLRRDEQTADDDRTDDSDEEQITKLDLGDTAEEEPTLPPHNDPLITEIPELPLPHITRFDLGAFTPRPALSPFDATLRDQQSSSVPRSKGATTGSNSPNRKTPSRSRNGEDVFSATPAGYNWLLVGTTPGARSIDGISQWIDHGYLASESTTQWTPGCTGESHRFSATKCCWQLWATARRTSSPTAG